jgi:hypothetical protein
MLWLNFAEDREYKLCHNVVQNIISILPKIGMTERYSGLFRTIIACCSGTNISSRDLADLLQINRNSALAGQRKREHYFNNQSQKLNLARTFTKKKLSSETKTLVQEFISKNVTPSASKRNVIKKKETGKVELKAKHWRTESLESLYNSYLDTNQQNWLSFSAFYNQIPWYVHAKPQRSGLCIYHDRAFRIQQILKNFRLQWHLQCKCICIFCRLDGCNHGNKSSDCLEGNCDQCSLGCCPLEMTDKICQYTIVEHSYETTAKGNKKLKQLTNTYQQEQQQFLGLWNLEMDNFKEHSKHVKYHKNQMEMLFSYKKRNSR